MKIASAMAAFGLLWDSAQADVVLRLPTNDRVVALTLDACEQQRAMKLDTTITNFLVQRRIPFTMFLSGRFVEDNASAIQTLAALPFVELENHSWDHPLRMQVLEDDAFRDELRKTDDVIFRLTGQRTRFFRFPAIRYNDRTLRLAEALDYTVVHYRWEVGDPDKSETAKKIVRETLEVTRPGDILIYHANGRGWHSGEAMPAVVDGLLARGYRFVLLRSYLSAKRGR